MKFIIELQGLIKCLLVREDTNLAKFKNFNGLLLNPEFMFGFERRFWAGSYLPS